MLKGDRDALKGNGEALDRTHQGLNVADTHKVSNVNDLGWIDRVI